MIEKKLNVSGPGYGAKLEGRTLALRLGASHPFSVELPDGVEALVEGRTIVVRGQDKQRVGQCAAWVLGLRKRDPYTGHGVSDCAKVYRQPRRSAKSK